MLQTVRSMRSLSYREAHTLRKDWIGRQHPAAGPNARIVSLVPSLTETLFALGLGAQVVGRTGFCVHPITEIQSVPKVGGTKSVNVQKICALEPTHLLVNIDENEKPTVDALSKNVPNIVVTHPQALDDNLILYALLGSIFDAQRRARTLAWRFIEQRCALARDVQGKRRLRVIYLIWRDPWMTVSPNTYIGQTLAKAGLDVVPTASLLPYPVVHDLHELSRSADLTLLASEPYRFSEEHARLLMQNQEIACPAYCIDGEMAAWYGSRAIEGMQYLHGFARQLRELSAKFS